MQIYERIYESTSTSVANIAEADQAIVGYHGDPSNTCYTSIKTTNQSVMPERPKSGKLQLLIPQKSFQEFLFSLENVYASLVKK